MKLTVESFAMPVLPVSGSQSLGHSLNLPYDLAQEFRLHLFQRLQCIDSSLPRQYNVSAGLGYSEWCIRERFSAFLWDCNHNTRRFP